MEFLQSVGELVKESLEMKFELAQHGTDCWFVVGGWIKRKQRTGITNAFQSGTWGL